MVSDDRLQYNIANLCELLKEAHVINGGHSWFRVRLHHQSNSARAMTYAIG